MGIRMPRIIQTKQILQRTLSNGTHTSKMDVPKGYFAVYVGEQAKKRFVIPVSLLRASLHFKTYYITQRKSLDMTIQWVVSQSLAVSTHLLISQVVWAHYEFK
ncbi:hypothetical protein LXL04_019722 [Taraxacum kok-saghyz]